MGYFEIVGDKLIGHTETSDEIFGIYLGGRWCLDYTFKLIFQIDIEDWNTTFKNIKNDIDLYYTLNYIGLRYKKDGKLYYKGQIINEQI